MYFRLSDADQARYGGQEWMRLVVDDLFDVPASRLAEWERETHPLTLLDCIQHRTSAAALRSLMWIARKFHGFESEKLTDFDPAVLGARFLAEPPGADEGKAPSETSSDSSATEAP